MNKIQVFNFGCRLTDKKKRLVPVIPRKPLTWPSNNPCTDKIMLAQLSYPSTI